MALINGLDPIHRASYISCYELMRSENKYGVIEFAHHPTIKDGYIFALEPFEPLPSEFILPIERHLIGKLTRKRFRKKSFVLLIFHVIY